MAKNPFALPKRTILASEKRSYQVVNVLGSGGFGVTYLAKGKIKVDNVWVEGFFAIKELFPSDFSHRVDTQILPNQGHEEEFRKAKADFLLEASRLQSIGTLHDNIVKVNEVFEANGTAYYVMQYVNGRTLYEYVNQYGGLPFDFAYKILAPIMQAVEFLHQSRINHFDIKPDNVMLQMADNEIQPVLIDFGLSIHFRNDGNKTTARSFGGVSEGYAPLEQYAEIKHFSPATDVYALAATLVYMLLGTQPKPAPTLRIPELRQLLLEKVPENVADAICHAMLPIEQRTPSVDMLRNELTGVVPPPSFAPHPGNPMNMQQPYGGSPAWQQPAQHQNAIPRPTVKGNFRPAETIEPIPELVNPTEQYVASPSPINGPGNSTVNIPGNSAHATVDLPNAPAAPAAKNKPKKGVAPWLWAVASVVILGAATAALIFFDVIKLDGITRGSNNDYISDLENIASQGEDEDDSDGDNPQQSTSDSPSEATAPTTAENQQSDSAATQTAPVVAATTPSSGSTNSSSASGHTSSTSSGAAATSGSSRTQGSAKWNANGTYEGQLVNGKPDGRGKIKFTADGTVDRRVSNQVSAGYILEGTFSEGKILSGTLYDENGNRVASIVP